MHSLIYLDIETQRSKDDVGGWFPEKMGLGLAVTYDSNYGYRTWFENDIRDLIAELNKYSYIVGYNLKDFDYVVLMAYDNNIKSNLENRTIDILYVIYKKLGFRVKLDDIVRATLGRGKSGDGLQSLKWWKDGNYQLVLEYCKEDVRLTKELFEFGQKNKVIYYPTYGVKKPITVDWEVE